MNLIERIYEVEKEWLDYDRPYVFYYDMDDSIKVTEFLKNVNNLDTDLSYDGFDYNIIEIFNRLGYGKNDSICLHDMEINKSRYNLHQEGSCNFRYSINSLDSDDVNKIEYYGSNELFYDNYSFYPGVKVTEDNMSIYYTVGSVPVLRKYDIKLDNNVTLTREYSNNEVLFTFDGIDSSFIVRIKKPLSKIVKSCNYILDNELKLVNYFRNLKASYDILEIYKNICDISLGKDMELYSEITLCETKKVNNSWKDINLLTIKNGEVDTIIRTVGDKTITYYSNDNWRYVLSDENILFTIDSGKTLRYSIETKNYSMMDDYMDSLLKYDISVAKSEVDETKRLVREKVKLNRK